MRKAQNISKIMRILLSRLPNPPKKRQSAMTASFYASSNSRLRSELLCNQNIINTGFNQTTAATVCGLDQNVDRLSGEGV